MEKTRSEHTNGKIHFDIDTNNYCPIGENLTMAMCNDITEKGDGGVVKQIISEGSGSTPKKGSKIYGKIMCSIYKIHCNACKSIQEKRNWDYCT